MIRAEKDHPVGDLYIEGLRGIQKKFGVSLEEAFRIALEDLDAAGASEHIEPTRLAFDSLRNQQGEN